MLQLVCVPFGGVAFFCSGPQPEPCSQMTLCISLRTYRHVVLREVKHGLVLSLTNNQQPPCTHLLVNNVLTAVG